MIDEFSPAPADTWVGAPPIAQSCDIGVLGRCDSVSFGHRKALARIFDHFFPSGNLFECKHAVPVNFRAPHSETVASDSGINPRNHFLVAQHTIPADAASPQEGGAGLFDRPRAESSNRNLLVLAATTFS